MKKIVCVLLTILTTTFAFAQDVIVTKEGRKINSKVTEINENDIKYKNFENLNGPTYTMKKSEIATIIYENGQVEVFNLSMNTTPAPQSNVYNTTPYTQADFKNAKTLRNIGIGCFAGGLGLSLVGYILAVTSWEYYGGYIYFDGGQAVTGSILNIVGSAATISGIVMWPVGQSRMNKIKRANPQGFSLFENEKVQLNLALGGNNMKLKLNF